VERKYLGTIDGAIVNSVATRNALVALIGERAPTIIAPPPTDRFGAAISEKEVAARAFEPGPLRLVFVGSVTRRKGLDTLLQALQSLPASDWRLEVVGSLETEVLAAKRARRRAAALGSAHGVEFRGHLGEDDLAAALRQAQVLVVPSTYEGFGIAYVEGMAYGLPAVGTTAGAAPETIQDGVNGFLIPPGNAALLSDRLRQLHGNRQLLATIALSARRTYLSRPAWAQTVGRIRDFLGRAIADYTCYNH
jgi:glycosyltransferase involved in cell wall biosynthesis